MLIRRHSAPLRADRQGEAMEPGPVLERCRNGGVIRWARIGLQLGQFHPLIPKPMEVLDILLRRRSLGWKQQIWQKRGIPGLDLTGAGRPADSIVANGGRS